MFETDLSDAESASVTGLSLTGIIGSRVTDLLDIEKVIEGYDRELSLAGSR